MAQLCTVKLILRLIDKGVAERMPPWTVEYGTLWALQTDNSLPPLYPARVEIDFTELGPNEVGGLASAMNLPSSKPIEQRLQDNRRCFIARVNGQIASYGWVTLGVERVGELERQFNLGNDEAYIWDCATVPAWRRQGCYSALLNHIIYRLHNEGVARLWIGASRQNQPSIQGIANAGFNQIVDVTYHRFFRLTVLWFREAPAAPPALVSAAYCILLNRHERRFGPLAIGYKQ